MERIVIAGASAAGLAAAESLRAFGFGGELTLVDPEPGPPYDRPPLSKQLLRGEWGPSDVYLRPAADLDQLGARWLLGRRSAALDVERRTVTLDDGSELEFDGLVIATGARSRQLPGTAGIAGIHTLRDLDEAIALRDALRDSASLVVVGAGFLGSEIAAVARSAGHAVTLIDPLSLPMVRAVGPFVGGRLADLHRDHGVTLRLDTGLSDIETAQSRFRGATLDDGSHVAGDLLVAAVGAVPNVEWLISSGLSTSNGVDCDEFGVAAPGIVAAGDVANWKDARTGQRVRIEHRLNAAEQGRAVAARLLGRRESVDHLGSIPYFWSDQYDVRIQVYGRPRPDAEFDLTAGSVDDGRFAGVYRVGAETVAALAWNMPKEARALRALIATHEERSRA